MSCLSSWTPVKIGRAKVTMTVYCDVYEDFYDDRFIDDPIEIAALLKDELESDLPGSLHMGDFSNEAGSVVEYTFELVENEVAA